MRMPSMVEDGTVAAGADTSTVKDRINSMLDLQAATVLRLRLKRIRLLAVRCVLCVCVCVFVRVFVCVCTCARVRVGHPYNNHHDG